MIAQSFSASALLSRGRATPPTADEILAHARAHRLRCGHLGPRDPDQEVYRRGGPWLVQCTGKRVRGDLCGWVADEPLLSTVELSVNAKHGPWFDLLTPFGFAAFGTVYPAEGQWDLVEVYGATRWWPLDRAGRIVEWPTVGRVRTTGAS